MEGYAAGQKIALHLEEGGGDEARSVTSESGRDDTTAVQGPHLNHGSVIRWRGQRF